MVAVGTTAGLDAITRTAVPHKLAQRSVKMNAREEP